MLDPQIVLLLWPLAAIFFFSRFSVPTAIAVTIVGGYLLLPTQTAFNLPALPTLNKDLMPVLCAIILATRAVGRSTYDRTPVQVLPGWLPTSVLGRTLMMALLIATLLNAFTNGDRQVFGPRILIGLTWYDGFSNLQNIIVTLLPLLIARRFLASPDSHRIVLVVLCIAGALYALPALYEVRMSPQLNRMFYGFFPHQWVQHIRNDGFRPVVFLYHGLWLGIFFSMATIAAAACLKLPELKAKKGFFTFALFWLFGTLFLAKTFGALAIAILLLPVVIFLGVRLQLIAATGIAVIMLAYPVLRGADVIPVDRVSAIVANIDPGRAASLRYRLTNEAILLRKANQRPLLGWGSRGRNRVFDQRGRDISTTDGGWIILIGQWGWLGYLSRIGLLAMPIVWLTLRREKLGVTAPTAGLCLVLGAGLIDLIPNDTLTPLTWMIAGALIGRIEWRPATTLDSEAEPIDTGSSGSRPQHRYSRFGPQKGNASYSRRTQSDS